VPKQVSGGTELSTKEIENQAGSGFVQNVVSKIPGAAISSSGEFHIRGSHGQYTYYLDGAPLPASVSGSFEDLINPKIIDHVVALTGGFPAYYGGNLAAVFDVTSKAGQAGPPTGSIQQTIQGDSTYNSMIQASGGDGRFTYFLSGVRDFTNRQLDPVTENPIHDGGNQTVGFGKFDYQAGENDRIIYDAADTSAFYQIPNTPDREALGQNDTQRENGVVNNLIWRHTPGADSLTTAFYSHASRLQYFPSAADLIGASVDNPLATAFENRTSSYYGLRIDYKHPFGKNHILSVGTDNSTMIGSENFTLSTNSGGATSTIADNENISGNDRGMYIQDDFTPGRFRFNYGARYDIHKTDTTASQLSPRFNAEYALDSHGKLHADYDRLFEPAPVEDVRKLDSTAAPFKPERDTMYEIGYAHTNAGSTQSFSAYYKTEQDVIDENVITGTLIPEPFNVAKGYVRGLEWAFDGPVNPQISYYFNYSRSWAQSAGNFTGGFIPLSSPPGWFYDDHDQTSSASAGLSYDHDNKFANIDADYGSGFPYGQDAAGNVNYLRVDPHLIFNSVVGVRFNKSEVAFTVLNVLNHPYVITEGGVFSQQQWGQGRTFGLKITQNF
jgi:outer membrane receptor for ferrienterochelin and colicin